MDNLAEEMLPITTEALKKIGVHLTLTETIQISNQKVNRIRISFTLNTSKFERVVNVARMYDEKIKEIEKIINSEECATELAFFSLSNNA